MRSDLPIIGITADVTAEKYQVSRGYVEMVVRAGGIALVLPCRPEAANEYLDICHGLVLTGGDDPDMSYWGRPMHPKAKPMDPQRQQFELHLLDALEMHPSIPALGVCLGMQLMGLHAGGDLDQHLPDHLPTADQHWNKGEHPIEGKYGRGVVHSHHRQALTSSGDLSVVATAPDGIIEAVEHRDRPFYVGVQWHPERTENPELGLGLFQRLILAARNARCA